MMKCLFWLVFLVVALARVQAASIGPSSDNSKSRVSVKKVSGLCETTPGVESYAGHVTLPPSDLFPYEQNLFFWFFESRQDPKNDPLALWINGGPGSPSIDQAIGSNGPCRVLNDSDTTVLNEWSWNNKANLLYIDQPVQTGFSFDTTLKGQLDLLTATVFPDGGDAPPEEAILVEGVFSSQNSSRTLNTSQNVARVMWDFMHAWQEEKTFKDYKRNSIHLWSQSYGGHFVPAIATYFESQSDAQASGRDCPSSSSTSPIRIASVGIIAAFVDILLQNLSLVFAYTNPYGIEIFDPATVDDILRQFNEDGGCRDLIGSCRDLIEEQDPEGFGNATEAQEPCISAFQTCFALTELPYALQGRDPFDITQTAAEQFPPPYGFGFLNREHVQEQLGTKVNYTSYSNAVGNSNNFVMTGDVVRSYAADVESLLNADIPVTFVFGDRDWRSNWFGGEAMSLALSYYGASQFAQAGYADLVVGEDDQLKGYSRQYGRYSYNLLLQAGHEAPHYQPEAAYAIFQRDLDGVDIAAGREAVEPGSEYGTRGPTYIRDMTTEPPSDPQPVFCYVAFVPLPAGSCSDAQLEALADGTAVIKNFIVIDPAWTPPSAGSEE